MELNTVSQSDFTKLAKVIWLKGLNSVPQVMRGSGIVKEMPIAKHSGNTREFSEIDGEEYAKRKGESDQAERAKVQQGYTKTMKKYRVANDIGISFEMRDENKYPEVMNKLTALGKQAPNRMDLDLAHRLSFATATTYTDMDGVTVDTTCGDSLQLAYSAHTLKGSSTTFRNRLSNNPQLSQGALESAEKLAVEETFNQFGEKMTMSFDILFTTDDPNTRNMAKYILQSTSNMDQANAGVTNVYQGSYKHIVLPRLATDKDGAVDSTKKKYWGIVSSSYSTLYLGVWEEARLKTPKPLNAGEEFSTDDWNYGVRAGYGVVTVSAPWIKLSTGDGVA